MKKIFILALLTISLAACSASRSQVSLSGNMKAASAKDYSIMLPEECEVMGSEISDISAQYNGCSVAVVTMDAQQATVCADKAEFSQIMEGLGYNLSVTGYEKAAVGGRDAYIADYTLEKTKITQITYINSGTAYIATYARPADVGKDTDEIFIEGLKAFEITEKD